MKVIHYIPSIDRTSGGVGTYIQLLSKELGKICELYIVTSHSEHPLKIENANVITIPSSLFQYKLMKKEWCNILDKIKPDLIHENCCWLPHSALTQKWAQEKGYKIILTPHGMLEPWIISRHYLLKKLPALFLYQKNAIKKANCLHATAESEKNNLLDLGYNNHIEIIPNCIDVDNIRIKDSWKKNKNILFLSRIHVKKGIENLIEAIYILKTELKGYVFNIAGEGDDIYITKLKKLVSKLKLDKYINFCGGIYGEDKWEMFRSADLFILPTYSENFGIVVAEALACGTPVITTKGTPWEELISNKCGWWTEIGKDGIIEALKDFLLLSEKDLEIMGKNGRLLIENKYSTKKIANDMFILYNKIISN